MIKIYDKLWFIVGASSEETLAYMCQYELTNKGTVSSSTKKMQETGRRWARKGDDKDSGEIIDNLPTKGLYVGNSVSRWSTSNKLFRVEDPRGFTVEIPTDNLATLLHHTTVINGVVQEECVWGRDGGNHILLPVNSEPYKRALKNQDIIENKLVNISDLKEGDCVKFFGDNDEYVFYGRVKITWRLRGHKRPTWYNKNIKEELSDWYEFEDDKYTNIFIKNGVSGLYASTPAKPKIEHVVGKKSTDDINLKDVSWLSPADRVVNKLREVLSWSSYWSYKSELVSVKRKGE